MEISQVAGLSALVIDDEVSMLEMVGEALKGMKCRATLIDSSAGVEAVLDHGDFDFVMCDLKMPVESGLGIYRLVRRKWPNLAERFLLMKGNIADAGLPISQLATVPVLLKPFTLHRLGEALAQVLRKDAMADEKRSSCRNNN
jgi:DNA-binding NtrC family response regulator